MLSCRKYAIVLTKIDTIDSDILNQKIDEFFKTVVDGFIILAGRNKKENIKNWWDENFYSTQVWCNSLSHVCCLFVL